MKNLNIGYFADGPWSHEAFKLLIKDNDIKVKFIVPRFDTKDITLQKHAVEHNIDLFKHKNINSEEFIEQVKKYNCDLFVSMSFNQIFKNKLINLPPLKTINCHAGKLPFYRGRNILNWVLINDEKDFGITVHYMNEGIDTGDIIMQRTYPITDDDNYSTLLETAYKECATSLYDAIKQIQKGEVHRKKQHYLHSIGFYCGQRTKGDEIINWNQTSREIFNFVRAICKPGPMAQTYCKGKKLAINKVKMIKSAPNYISIIGQVVGKTNESIIVKTKDNTIELIEYEYEGKLNIGDRLGSL